MSQLQPGPSLSPPPSYESVLANSPYHSSVSASHDPRSSSMQSLVPENRPPNDSRRKLLLVYIHGFMGNETSFQSFPAHVHNLVSVTLAETHAVHTKIYPRYKTRRSLEVVAEDFSSWLTPHESPEEDVILIGHSMGGLLSAEVVFLQPNSAAIATRPTSTFRHRILGTINLDVPFLGIHPGVVTSGLASLFRPGDSNQPPASQPAGHGGATGSTSSTSLSTNSMHTSGSTSTLGQAAPVRHDTLFSTTPSDPNFNAPFENDVNLKMRKGWRSTMHFISKHSDGLRHATKQYVKSHAEFGGAMADFRGLHARYARIRALEDVSVALRRRGVAGNVEAVPRVRFVNYYTACDGRPKRAKTPERLHVDGPAASSSSSLDLSRTPSPRISVEEIRDDGIVSVPLLEPPSPIELDIAGEGGRNNIDGDNADLTPLETSITTTSIDPQDPELAELLSSVHVNLPVWPPLSPLPMEPSAPNLSLYSDKSVQSALKREHERKMKAYKQAVKDQESILADRKKVEDKLRRAAAKEELKKRKTEGKDQKKEKAPKESSEKVANLAKQDSNLSTSQTEGSYSTSTSLSLHPSGSTDGAADVENKKKPKERRFCVLPSKNDKGERDPLWVRVFMKDMDEVQAHCGLFFVNETYERLVGDVGGRIEEWVKESLRSGG